MRPLQPTSRSLSMAGKARAPCRSLRNPGRLIPSFPALQYCRFQRRNRPFSRLAPFFLPEIFQYVASFQFLKMNSVIRVPLPSWQIPHDPYKTYKRAKMSRIKGTTTSTPTYIFILLFHQVYQNYKWFTNISKSDSTSQASQIQRICRVQLNGKALIHDDSQHEG